MWRLAGFSREPGKMPQAMCKRLAYDEGMEMARHKELSKALTLNVYLCDLHAIRQRPSNGNMNGPLRHIRQRASICRPGRGAIPTGSPCA